MNFAKASHRLARSGLYSESALNACDRFRDWFGNHDLGHLEDVRDYVEMHALDNVVDVPVNEIYQCAKATVEMYLDDKEMADETFNYYRKF